MSSKIPESEDLSSSENRVSGTADPAPKLAGQNDADDRQRELELELIRVRAEAQAARLDAKAARIELLIRRISRSASDGDAGPGDTQYPATRPEPLSPPLGSEPGHAPQETAPSFSARFFSADSDQTSRDEGCSGPTTDQLFDSWDAVRGAMTVDDSVRHDAIKKRTARSDSPTTKGDTIPMRPAEDDGGDIEDVAAESESKSAMPHSAALALDAQSRLDQYADYQSQIDSDLTDVPQAVDVWSDPSGSPPPRRRPAAWLASAVIHAIILIALAGLSLSVHDPKDQLAFAASVSETTETTIESFTLESDEPVIEQADPVESEVQYEQDPLGEMLVSEVTSEMIPREVLRPAPPAPTSLRSNPLQTLSKPSPADKKSMMKFCGVEGGGNHFVYLVDSSGSMGEAFVSARAALLSSIEQLTPTQRFYVIFFDANPDFMRLTDPHVDEPRSVPATPENKRRLRQWAMRISMDRGRAPYDPLKFAFKIRPDVVFLLSDGEFPQGIEDLILELNHFENLFGDSGIRCIVNTIGYFSREGESRMKRIAAQNRGQYQYVPES